MNATIDEGALHAIYAPSSAHRWTICTASATAISKLGEQEEGDEAAEGTRAHDEIERCFGLTEGVADWRILVNPDHPAEYGVALVMHYVQQLQTLYPGKLWVEQRVHLTEQIWGRCDVAHWDPVSETLTIVDYKNGKRAVDAEENEQLRIYAAGSIYTHHLPAKWIRYAVIQPNDWRPFVPRVKPWFETAESLYEWASATAAIPLGILSFIAGDHCRDCPLFGKCEAALDVLANVGALVSGLVQPADVRPEQVAIFLAMQKPIEDAYKTFKKYWETRSLKTGVAPSDMKIVTTGPHRAWTDPEAARRLLLEKLGSGALDVPTPAQAIERGISETVVYEMAPRPPGGPVLAFASDKRKPWTGGKTSAEMFRNLPGVSAT